MLLPTLLLACTDRDRASPHTGDDDDDDVVATASTGHTGASTATTGDPRPDEEVLMEGFLWGYALVFSMRTTHDKPYNQLNWNLARPDEQADHVPNPDVLYGLAPVDLNAEPIVIHTTTVTDRYWCLQLSDLFAETFAYLGTRGSEQAGGDYLLVPPGWKGTVPADHQVIEAPSRQAALLARYHVRDDADLAAARAATAGITVRPLSGATVDDVRDWPYPMGPFAEGRDGTGLNGIEFWDELGLALTLHPARPEEQHVVDGLARFGIGPGLTPSTQVTDLELRELLEGVPGDGVDRVEAATLAYKNWVPQLGLGQFEGDWESRAAWAFDGWITHAQEEAVYARSELLPGGSNEYKLRFEADQLPPDGWFWSISVYTEDGHLVANPWDRFSFQEGNVWVGGDGSVDLHFAKEYPDGVRNWLPIPQDDAPFSVALRTYIPTEVMFGATPWQPPPIVLQP